MLKYLLVGLLLLATLSDHAQSRPEAVNFAASASYRTVADGRVVDARIDVWQTPTDRQVGLILVGTAQVCAGGACRIHSTPAGVTYAEVGTAGATLDQDLRLGAVHATLRVHDERAGTELPVRLDVVWTGRGPVFCGDVASADGCTRLATATATVAVGGQVLIQGQTVADAQLAWHRRSG